MQASKNDQHTTLPRFTEVTASAGWKARKVLRQRKHVLKGQTHKTREPFVQPPPKVHRTFATKERLISLCQVKGNTDWYLLLQMEELVT